VSHRSSRAAMTATPIWSPRRVMCWPPASR